MLRTEKEGVVADLVLRLKEAETLIVADYRGLTHKEIDGVRTELLKHGARFAVCKNTLARSAAEEAGVSALLDFLTGPTAIAFVVDGDMVAVAKALDDTAKATRRMSLKGGVLSGTPIDADGVKSIASLPPVDVLRGQVLGAIVGPLTSLVGLAGAPLQSLVGLIDARIDQLGGSAEAEPALAEPSPAPDLAAGTSTDSEPAAGGEPVAESEPAVAAPEADAEPAAAAATEEQTQDDAATPDEPAADGGEEQE